MEMKSDLSDLSERTNNKKY